MKKAQFTIFPGAEIAFVRSVAELSDEAAVVAADPEICLRWKRDLLEVIGVKGASPRLGRITRGARRHISGYLFRDDIPLRKRFHGRPVFRDAQDLPDNTVVLLSATRWERDLITYHERGFRRFAALPARDLSTGWRRAILSQGKSFIFLQNYKVMYSAFRDFMRDNLPEFAGRPNVSYALNSNVDFLSPSSASYYKFSVVRNPWDRMTSAYRDKLCRGEEHENYRNYREPIGAIMGCGPDISFETFVRYSVRIPDSHANQHWVSQYANLHVAGEKLVDYIGRFEKLDECLQELRRATGIAWRPGHLHRTSVTGSSYHDDYRSDEVIELVRKRYRDDIDAFGYSF